MAAAQPEPDAYDRLVNDAIREFDAANYQEARALFDRAHATRPSARTSRALGFCSFELHQYVQAVRELEEALGDSRHPLTDTQRAEASATLLKARSFIGQLTLVTEPAQAKVLIDGSTVTSESGSASGGIAAPSVFIGRVYDQGMADDVLPRTVRDLRRVPVEFTHNSDSVAGGFRAIVSVWLSSTASADTGFASGGTLEVWPYAKPGQMPNGSVQARALSLTGVPGSWDVWVGTYADRPAVVYLRTEAASMVQIDLKPFLTDAAQRPNAIDAAWYVTSISAGFDIYEGGAGLHIDVANISAE